jgi:hypothetical protein
MSRTTPKVKGIKADKLEKKRIVERVDWPVPNLDKLQEARILHQQNDCIAMMLEGRKTDEIKKFLAEKYNLDHQAILNRYNDSLIQLQRRKDWEVDNIINLHLNRYEELYAVFIQLDAIKDAAACLRAKEKLMQFHKQGTHLKVVNSIITQVTTREVENMFDLTRLDVVEQDRLESLVDKASLNQ